MTEIRNLPQFKEGMGFKFDYSKVKKCVMKKEAGEPTDECKKMWDELGIKEA